MKPSCIFIHGLFLALPFAASSQAFVVSSDGKDLADGSVVETGYSAITTPAASLLKWDPKLTLRSTGGKVNVEVELTTDASGYKICWPNVCREVVAGVPFWVEAPVGETPEDMATEQEMVVKAGDEIPESTATLKITDDNGESVTVTLVSRAYDVAGTEAVSVTRTRYATDYYTVDGRKLPEPLKGLNVVRYSDGSVEKILKR